jgi:hypothetical protein
MKTKEDFYEKCFVNFCNGKVFIDNQILSIEQAKKLFIQLE